MKRSIRKDLPSRVTLGTLVSGKREQWGHVMVKSAGKPPKLRFHPGSFIKFQNNLYEILYAFRTVDDPHEWIYCLAERTELSSSPKDMISQIAVAIGAGDTTPRIVYELFKSSYDATRFFGDIVSGGDTVLVTNKRLLQNGNVISSGEIVS